MSGKYQVVGLTIVFIGLAGVVAFVAAGHAQQSHAQGHYYGKYFGQLSHFLTSYNILLIYCNRRALSCCKQLFFTDFVCF